MAVNEDNGRLKFEAILNDKGFKKGIEDIINGFDRTQEAGEKAAKKQQGVWGSLNNALTKTGGILKTLFAGFGLVAGLGAVFSLIRSGARDVVAFDKSMTNMGAIAGKTRSELSSLEKEIRKVAAESINTATSVADMATELIKLGTTPEGVKALLKPVNDLSIASQMSADATAVLLKGTLNAFQETEKEATRYADVMAKAIGSTALDAQKMGDAFSYIASTASVAGYSIEETAAMIGTLVDNNVQASSAGRVLSSVFGRLAKGGKELEGELEKIRNSQDKLAQASKIFGAEGARLGVILANNKDKLANLTTEFENSAGSLAKLTAMQLESVASKYDIMISAWQEFVFSVENGSGIISKSIKVVIGAVTDLLVQLAKLNNNTSTEGRKSDRILGHSQRYYEILNENVDKYIARQKELAREKGINYTAEMQREDELSRKRSEIDRQRLMFIRQIQDTEAQIGNLQANKDSGNGDKIIELQKLMEAKKGSIVALQTLENELMEEGLKTTDETKKSNESSEDILKKRLALLEKIEKTERGINESVLSERESSIQKVLDKYIELNKEAVKLGMNTKKINDLQAKELEVVTYKSDTDNLKESLTEQRALYEEFEKAKQDLGEKQAKEMYSNLIDVSRNYYDLLNDELDKVDTKDMDAKERNRYSVLLGLLDDYDKKRSEIDRAYLSDVVKNTKSTEEKLNAIRLEYAKKRAEIENNFVGVEQENRLSILDKKMKEEYKAFFDELLSGKDSIGSIYSVVAGATKSQIIAQMESLKRLLSEESKIVDSQKDVIRKTLVDLNEMMRGSQNDLESSSGRFSMLKSIEAEVTAITAQIKILNDEKEKLKVDGIIPSEAEANLVEINGKLLVLSNRLKNISGDRLDAVSSMFGEVASEVSVINDLIGNQDSQVEKVLSTMSKLIGVVDVLNKSFQDVSNSLNDISRNVGDAGTSMSSSLSQAGAFLSVFSSVTSIFEGIFSTISKASERRDNYEMERLRKELDYQRKTNDRLLKEASKDSLGIKGKKKEMDVLRNTIDETDQSLMDLFATMNDPNRVLGFISIWKDTGQWGEIPKMVTEAFSYKNWDEMYSKANSNQKKFMDSIDTRGKSLLEIMEMYERGIFSQGGGDRGIDKKTIAFLDRMRELGEILSENKDKLQEFQNQLNEMVTGTSLEFLADEFSNFLKNGEDAVFGFGETFEDVLKNAVVNSFKNQFILESMQGLFNEMAKMGDDGYSQAEIDALRLLAKETAEKLQSQWEGISNALDLDFTGDQLGGSARDAVKRITESQADRLTGIMVGVHSEVIQIRGIHKDALNALNLSNNLLNSSYQTLISIEANTRRGADGIDSINGKMDLLIYNNQNNTQQSLGL